MLRKITSFLKSPHIPSALEQNLKTTFPRMHRLLKYRAVDPFTKKYWDGVWREEGMSTWRTYPNLFGKICEEVRTGSRVLDIGCGPGILLRKLNSELDCKGFGLDISSVAIKLLKENDIPGVVASLPEMPFKDSCFDIVIATEVLEHLETPYKVLHEMKRVTKDEGFLICSVPNEVLTKEECDEHLHNFTMETFRNLVEDFGNSTIMSVDDKGGQKLLAVIKKFKTHYPI